MSSIERTENLTRSIEGAVKGWCEDHEDNSTKAKAAGFAVWCLTEVFGFDRDDAIDSIVDGRDDRSMDAVADDGNRLVVLQTKYNSHEWSEITKFRADVAAIGAGTATNLARRLKPLAAEIRTRRQEDSPVAYYYVTNRRLSQTDLDKIGTLEDEPAIEVLDLDGIYQVLAERESERPTNSPNTPVQLTPAVESLKFEDSLITPIHLVEFSRFVAEGEKWLFESNVRQYLSRSKVNKGIRDTLEEEPEHFWRFNNGVTMVVDDFSEKADGTLSLLKPQIVNGCQTSLSIKEVISSLDARQKKDVRGHVLVRIIKEPSDEERRKITQFTNLQTAVRGKDFFALKDFQRDLKRRVDALGYFYEIQTGSYDMTDDSEKDKLRGDSRFAHLKWARKDYRIQAIEAAKCHAAGFRRKVSVCYANPGNLAPNGALYDVIFPPDLTTEPEAFLMPFLLMKHAESELGYGSARGESWRRRGRYLFVYAAFRVLDAALKKAGRLDASSSLDPEHAPLVREVLANEATTANLVQIADAVLEGFFADSKIDELVNEDIFAFLKGPIEKDESLKILDLKIRKALDSQQGRQFLVQLKTALRIS